MLLLKAFEARLVRVDALLQGCKKADREERRGRRVEVERELSAGVSWLRGATPDRLAKNGIVRDLAYISRIVIRRARWHETRSANVYFAQNIVARDVNFILVSR